MSLVLLPMLSLIPGNISINLLHTLPCLQLLHPFVRLRHLVLKFLHEPLSHGEGQSMVPRHEHQVRVADLGTHKVWLPSLGQVCVDDAKDTFDLGAVAVDG